ncbi:hypothetical protein M074_2839 [Bacteroides fragilis str. DS-166]|nr:hypothetical protein M074_2839 [Bacteroides fragilis str. DS-166]EYE46812.1 hypothetical protein M127_2907 [Bacteroides fragilis str. S6L5]
MENIFLVVFAYNHHIPFKILIHNYLSPFSQPFRFSLYLCSRID